MLGCIIRVDVQSCECLTHPGREVRLDPRQNAVQEKLRAVRVVPKVVCEANGRCRAPNTPVNIHTLMHRSMAECIDHMDGCISLAIYPSPKGLACWARVYCDLIAFCKNGHLIIPSH